MRKELRFLAGALLVGGMATSAPEGRAQSCEVPSNMQPGGVDDELANLRISPTTHSEVLAVLNRESEIFVGEEERGQLVSVGGVSSNLWREVFLPSSCEGGYVWSGLVESAEEGVEEAGEYESLVFQSCPYYFVLDNVLAMTFGYREASDPDSVLAVFGRWRGRNLWQGYDDPNPLGIPEDVVRVGGLEMMLRRNEIPGRILENDVTGVWFYMSETTPDEVYVFPFRSYETFTDNDGNHEGAHLCGDYAIPLELYNELIDFVGEE